MKKHLSGIILVAMFLIGLSVLLYPLIADFWNSKHQSRVIHGYESALEHLNKQDFDRFFEAADDYNRRLAATGAPFASYGSVEGYDGTLNIDGQGTMGYIDIDKLGVEIPIYHGCSDAVLNTACGHITGSSLPVGGPGTHCALSAHRGLPSAKLFTDLDLMEVGDTFKVTVLDRVLIYEVDRIFIVYPNDLSRLQPVPGEDYCTLVTCTPYGINTKRLLVRGVRTDTEHLKAKIYVPNEALPIDPIIVTPVTALPMLFVLLIVLLVKYRKKKTR